MGIRRKIPLSVRRAVIARDGLICRWCGIGVAPRAGAFSPTDLHLDHLTPWAAGGDDTVGNLVVSCASCNLRKGGPRGLGRTLETGRPCVYEYAQRNHWWIDGFAPPVAIPEHIVNLMKVGEYATEFGQTVPRVIGRILRGDLPATTEGPILVPYALRVRRRIDAAGRRIA